MAPTAGDGRYVGRPRNGPRVSESATSIEREPTLPYLQKLARGAERAGFSTLLLPVSTNCSDGWIVASALMPLTEGLRFLVAVRPGFVQPAVAARQVSSFDALSGGRLSINIVTGGSPDEQMRDGDFLDHDGRYRRTFEFVDVLKRLFTEPVVDHAGEFYRLQSASLKPPVVQKPYPPMYIAGASGPGKRLAVNEANVYMTWGEPLDSSTRVLDEMRALATLAGRQLRFSTSFLVILGDTEDAAWARAQDLLDHIDPAVLNQHQQRYERFDSVGQKNLLSMMQDARSADFRLGPNLWAGLTQVLVGNSVALVGTPDQVALRLAEYVGIGFDSLLLRGFPHLETIEDLGRDVIPRVRSLVRHVTPGVALPS